MNFDRRFGAFFMLTGVTFVAFASGFGVCLFDISTVNECAAVSREWFDKFLVMGSQILRWFIALAHAVMKQ